MRRCGIKFAKNVIDEKDGRHAVDVLEPACLSELHREGDGALLALRRERCSVAAIQEDLDVVTMRSDNRCAQTDFFVAACTKGRGKVWRGSRLIGNFQRFRAA